MTSATGTTSTLEHHVDDGGGPRDLPRTRPAPTLPLPFTLAMLVLTYWCVDIVSPALPVMRETLALSATAAGLVMSLFFGGRLVANLPAAFLVDRAGPRWTAAAGSVVLLAGSALVAVASGLPPLLLARMLQGAGVALMVSAGLLSVLRALPGGGSAMTAFNVAAGVGSAGGLIAGGILTTNLGWRYAFWFSALLSGLVLAGAIATKTTTGHRATSTDPDAEPVPVVGAPARSLIGPLAANLLVYANYAIWVVALPLYAAGRFGLDANEIGLLLLVLNLIHLGAAFPAGRAIRRVGARPVLAVGMLLTAAGLGTALIAPTGWWLVLPLTFYAVGEMSANSAAGDLLLRLGGGGGRAVGMVRLSSDVGIVAGPAFAGWLADAAGLGAPFLAFAALSAISGALLLTLQRRRQMPGL